MNDLQSFIGRGFSNLRNLKSRGKSKKGMGSSSNGAEIGSDDMSPTAAAAADKLPV